MLWRNLRSASGVGDQRPLAYEERNFWWNIQRVPRTLPDGKTPHPGRRAGIFVVHGMGQQLWTETAAELRGGFEDAFEDIAQWQRDHPDRSAAVERVDLPPPLTFDGYWADYDNVKVNFSQDYAHFNERERLFFGNLWKHRVIAGGRTVAWALRQQIRLLNLKVLREVGPFAWIRYIPLQFVSTATLLFLWWRFPQLITSFLNDVRLYVEPRGVIERSIVQRIDQRVMDDFLRMIGLDRDFREITDERQLIDAGGESLVFDHVIWVAHSLGTVISYNVLSALFHKAEQIEHVGDEEQRAGVARFRRRLSRFVTMGSPLDKVAFLFGDESLRPWPGTKHRALLVDGETLESKDPAETEWWVNFYSVFDPISGPLVSPFICGEQVPSNIHARSGWVPGLAHTAYWKDSSILRFILGRTYGTRFLRDKEYRPWPRRVLGVLAAVGYIVWTILLFGIPVGAGYAIYRWGPELLRALGAGVTRWIMG